MKILFLTQLFPYPPVCGGTIRSWNVLKRLAERHEVTLAALVRGELGSYDCVNDICRAVHGVNVHRSGLLNLCYAASGLIRRKPFIVIRDHVQEMQDLVNRLTSGIGFDLIYVDHLQMAQYVRREHAHGLILDEHNVEWRILKRIAATARRGRRIFAELESRKLRDYELRACERFDKVITVTEEDRKALCADNPRLNNLCTVPIGVDLQEFSPVRLSANARAIVSIGTMSWPPNIDAVMYFARDIYPLVKQEEPKTRLVVAGSKPPKSVLNLCVDDSSIVVTGYVPDISALAEQAAVFVVPLRSGSGMRVKILNALAMGLPVVTTSLGCEGIDAMDGRDILIADDPSAFASAVVRLLRDPDERFRLGTNGRRLIEEKYSWESIYPILDAAVETIAESQQTERAARRVVSET